MHRLNIILLLYLLAILLTSCYSPKLDYAISVVHTADSICNIGGIYNDSSAIAEAVAILRPYQFSLSKDYARAEYYYGCLLCQNNYYEDAKEAYLRAVKSGAKDNQLIQKITSNLESLENIRVRTTNTNYRNTIIFTILGICILVLTLYEYVQYKYKDQIINYYQSIVHENKMLKEQNKRLYKQQEEIQINKMRCMKANIIALKESKNILLAIHWNDEERLMAFMNDNFHQIVNKLISTQVVNDREIKLCILVFLGCFSDKQMAEILFYSDKSIRGTKRKVAQKLGTSSAKLRTFLLNIAII